MLNGDVQEFVDGLYYGDERVFVYDDMEFFTEGFGRAGAFYIIVALFVPDMRIKPYWDCTGKNSDECVNKFLEAKIFKGKSFWEVERDITWIDFITDNLDEATKKYYNKHPEDKIPLMERSQNYQPVKLNDMPKEIQEDAIRQKFATFKDGDFYDNYGNIATVIDYFYWDIDRPRKDGE